MDSGVNCKKRKIEEETSKVYFKISKITMIEI